MCEKNDILKTFTDNLKSSSDILFKVDIPKKIMELTTLIESSHFQQDAVASIIAGAQASMPTDISPTGSCQNSANSSACLAASVPNTQILDMFAQAKPIFRKFSEDAQVIRLWILFNVPRIEDGNNFGVSIQEEAISETSRMEYEATEMMDIFSDYHSGRGRLVAKVYKWPQVEDYRKSVVEFDETTFNRMRNSVRETRNHYARLYDMIIKNMEKIKNPRNSHSNSMF